MLLVLKELSQWYRPLSTQTMLLSLPKHMLWILKSTVSMRRFFWAAKNKCLKLIFCLLNYTVLYREKAFHYSILAFYYSILAFYYSILAFYNSILAFYYSVLAFYHSILTFYNSVLAFYYSILAFNISRIAAKLMAPKDMIRETL